MFFSVNLDMSFQVVFEELTAVIFVQSADESLEHLRNRILTPVKELRGDIARRFIKTTNSVGDKVFDIVRNLGLVQGIMNSCSISHVFDEVLNRPDICSNLLHGLDVELEV
jgi:hypothetical protein